MANQTNQERLESIKLEMDTLKRTIMLHEEGIRECEGRLDKLYDLQDELRGEIFAEARRARRSSDLNEVLRDILGARQ